jgi:glycosyltransferase involved in cell wall biosynthesis
MPLVIKRAKRILTVSNFSKNDLLKSYNLKNEDIKVLYNGLSDNFNIENVKLNSVPKLDDYDLSPQRYFLASVKKNPAQLIKAFKLLDHADIKLVFFGKVFKVFEHLMPEIEASNNIVYLGEISDAFLYDLYTNATALVFPSLNEGFGIPLLEAMSCRCPIIASNLSSIPEVCGDAALFIDPYNVNDLADKMNALCIQDNLRSDLIKKGLARVLNFSFDKTVAELIDYLKNIGLYN